MDIEQVRNLGAPFAKAEVQISLNEKLGRLTLIVPDFSNGTYPQMEFQIDGDDYALEGAQIIVAATDLGLLHDKSEVTIAEVDSLTKLQMIQ